MINNEWFQKKVTLLENMASWENARTVLFGIPLDSTSSYRPGSRFAPEEIRTVFESLEEYSFDLEASILDAHFYDLGDLLFPPGNLSECLKRAEKVVCEIVKQNKTPLIIGGEHTVTLAPAGALLSCGYSDLTVLHFDAHPDLREEYLGEEISHASVINRIIRRGVKEVYQFGIRSAAAEEVEYARRNTKTFGHRVLTPLQEIIPALKQKPVYITIDIDVVDPGFAPGTGTPEPGGITSACLFKALSLIKDLNIVGFDLVEVSPPHDHAKITSILAAKIIREAILILEKNY